MAAVLSISLLWLIKIDPRKTQDVNTVMIQDKDVENVAIITFIDCRTLKAKVEYY